MLVPILIASTAEIILAFAGLITSVIGFSKLKESVHYLISFAAGTFLGLVFFDLLPASIAITNDAGFLYALGGFLLFFFLSRGVFWYHHHHRDQGTCPEDHPPSSGYMILIADTLHNFIDGILLTAAFMADFRLGVATTVAILLHELPQELSDYFVLIESGYSQGRALFINFLVGSTTLIGALLTFFFLNTVQIAIGPLLGLAAGNFLYIATADLIPTLNTHHQHGAKTTPQITLLLLGIALMYIVGFIGEHA